MNNFQTSLNTIDQQLNQLQYEHRVMTIKNYDLTILQMLGYSALALGTIYIMYRCKVFECIKSYIPSTLCINIHCCKQNTEKRIETPTISLLSAPNSTLNKYEDLISRLPPLEEEHLVIPSGREIVRFERTKRI